MCDKETLAASVLERAAEALAFGIARAKTARRAKLSAWLAELLLADVEVLDTEVGRLRAFRVRGARTLFATPHAIERALVGADVVIAAVRDESGLSPRICTRAHLSLLQPGAVIVDLSILDGGAFESTPVTSPEHPAVLIDGIVHVGVPNFAGSVPRTSSAALSLASLPHLFAALGT